MTKSRADIQRAYRERKKLSGATFLKKERQRQSTYRQPTALLSVDSLEMKRKRGREYTAAHRDRKKVKISTAAQNSPDPDSISTESTCTNQLIVAFDFNRPKNRNPRRSKALRVANKRIKELEYTNKKSKQNATKWAKRCQRLSTKTMMSDRVSGNIMQAAEMTPRTQTDHDIREAGLSPSSLPKSIRRKLDFSNVVSSELKASKGNTKKRRSIGKALCGKYMKKYRFTEKLSRASGINRRTLIRDLITKRSCNPVKVLVVSFINRDDNSVCLPGKKDSTKLRDKSRVQTRILTDYINNLHRKFLSENPGLSVSRSSFARYRPLNIKLTRFLSRSTCLCIIHQNMAFKLKAMRTAGINISINPQAAAKDISTDRMTTLVDSIAAQSIKFETWKTVVVDGTKKTRIIEVEQTKHDFVNTMKEEFPKFVNHVKRITLQYAAMKRLKENLPDGHVAVQMDFSENFTCKSNIEIQSAYWNATTVTLHPIVVWFKVNGELITKSFVSVSDDGDHSAKSVIAILDIFIPKLKELVQNATRIHYFTDGPSSQYRNKSIFALLTNHFERYAISAQWNFFEAGHGKGPCDGIGGTSKRQVSQAVKQDKVCIQDARDFFEYQRANDGKITYLFHNSEDIEKADAWLSYLNPSTVPGTMKVHAAIPVGSHIYIRHVSCYCNSCIQGIPCESKWIKQLQSSSVYSHQVQSITQQKCITSNLMIGDYLSARYLTEEYIGRVEEIDNTDNEIYVSFMENVFSKGGRKLRWPQRPDEVWVSCDDVIKTVQQPVPVGRSARYMVLAPDDE